jgi:pimeloyl-ACP methyl ester carboxylesterase
VRRSADGAVLSGPPRTFGGSSSRARGVLPHALGVTPVNDAPQLDCHCGTPHPDALLRGMYEARWASAAESTTTLEWSAAPIVVMEPAHPSRRNRSVDDVATIPQSRAGSTAAELEESVQSLVSYWANSAAEIPTGLVRDAIEEAATSDCAFGNTLERTSPLGDIDLFEAGRASSNWTLVNHMLQLRNLPVRLSLSLPSVLDDGGYPIVLGTENSEAASAIIFGRAGFLLPVPEHVSAVEVRVSVPRDPSATTDWDVLDELIDDGTEEEDILWRIYSGEHSWIRDVVTSSGRFGRNAIHHLSFAALEGAGLVVGKVLRRKARKLETPLTDPSFNGRLVWWEQGDLAALAAACPRLGSTFEDPARRAIVVVHGTMATGLPLAASLLEIVKTMPNPPKILRFEHDTWLELESNATDLAERIKAAGLREVSFLAHSRGGLVAARATEKLGLDSQVKVLDLLTLGTPFAGTPLALSARVSLELSHTLLGSLRAFGGIFIDVAARIAALALPYAAPAGIRVMEPGSSVLPSIVDHLPANAVTFAGRADGSRQTVRGPASSFMTGIGRGSFGGEPNDLVCAVLSAGGGRGSGAVVECDHFSYLNESAVQQAIAKISKGFDPE